MTVASAAVLHQAGVPFVYDIGAADVLTHLALIEGKSVFWTIVVEFKFYALFAVFWIVTAALSDRVRVLMLIAPYAAIWFWLPVSGKESVWQCLPIFITGMIAALAVRLADGRRVADLVLPVLIGAFVWMGLATLLLWGDDSPPYRSVPLHLCVGLLVWSAATASASVGLGAKAMQRLGDWSFGIYLLHLPVMLFGGWCADLLGTNRAWAIVPVVGAVLWISRLSYEFVEVPARRALTRSRKAVPA